MNSTVKALGALVLSTLAMSAATAQSAAEATLSNFRYTLTDLDLNDGITPSLALVPASWRFNAGYYGSGAVTDLFNQNEYGDPGTSLVAASYDNTPSTNAFRLASTISGDTMSTFAARTSAYTSYAGGAVSARADNDGKWSFLLSPNTSITFFLDAEVAASASAGVAAGLTPASRGEISATLYGDGWSNYDVATLRQEATFGFDTPARRGETFALDLENRTNRAWDLNLFTSTTAESFSTATPTTPVPEPETWGMLLAGIGILGAAKARRARA